jgi:hypothetical protein
MRFSHLFQSHVFFITPNTQPRHDYKGRQPSTSRYRISYDHLRKLRSEGGGIIPMEFVQAPMRAINADGLGAGFFKFRSNPLRKKGVTIHPARSFIINGNIIDWDRTREDNWYKKARLGTITQVRIKGSYDYFVLQTTVARLRKAFDAAQTEVVQMKPADEVTGKHIVLQEAGDSSRGHQTGVVVPLRPVAVADEAAAGGMSDQRAVAAPR